ncbi:flagellar motor switch phosphatase FliY [Siminovitchia terrae]|uniref:Flagellar motor switch phosphatase FliY n=1 Tax=Siminovitchia terrae TaxID=1914933 RepID=A0A429XBE2_SIMTE|nr:flagellar motor switch phosphatase FliY [Siminovitchia terrae]RST60754.1 flagellar motor switch phosphatase FliY [Siminovitchia terrae]GIN91367.1 flagellar motor switch phosphatase FliY [Siminovitchia terrae]GIN94698.1 flagellar motor switch phosphatase FliY [Siminovitchia terrae]
MNGEKLSQEEIEMLFEEMNQSEDESTKETDELSEIEKDALGEVGNISFGNAATALSTMMNQKVEITTPTVSIIDWQTLSESKDPGMAVQVTYTSGFSGVNVLFLKKRDVSVIADVLMGGDGTNPSEEMDEIQQSAVQEAMNQMIGSSATSMSSFFEKRVDISTPTFHVSNETLGEVLQELSDQSPFAQVSFDLKVGEIIDSKLTMFIPVNFAKSLVKELWSQAEETSESKEVVETSAAETAAAVDLTLEQTKQMEEPASSPAPRHSGEQPQNENVNVQRASFAQFDNGFEEQADTKNLDVLLDIPLQVTVELGRTHKSVKDILEMGSGSIIELDKLAGEPVDILINNRLIAKGEVVVIDESFGVRVTDILSRKNRLQYLK